MGWGDQARIARWLDRSARLAHLCHSSPPSGALPPGPRARLHGGLGVAAPRRLLTAGIALCIGVALAAPSWGAHLTRHYVYGHISEARGVGGVFTDSLAGSNGPVAADELCQWLKSGHRQNARGWVLRVRPTDEVFKFTPLDGTGPFAGSAVIVFLSDDGDCHTATDVGEYSVEAHKGNWMLAGVPGSSTHAVVLVGARAEVDMTYLVIGSTVGAGMSNELRFRLWLGPCLPVNGCVGPG